MGFIHSTDEIQVGTIVIPRYLPAIGKRRFSPQLAAGRALSLNLARRLNDLSLPSGVSAESIELASERSSGLVEWLIGNRPINAYTANDPNHPMSQCSEITRRERLKSAPYLRLKKLKLFEIVKRGTLWVF